MIHYSKTSCLSERIFLWQLKSYTKPISVTYDIYWINQNSHSCWREHIVTQQILKAYLEIRQMSNFSYICKNIVNMILIDKKKV